MYQYFFREREKTKGDRKERKDRKRRIFPEISLQQVANKVVFGDHGQRFCGLWPASTSCNSVTVIKESTAEPSGISPTNYNAKEQVRIPDTSISQSRASFHGFGSEDLNCSHDKMEQYLNCPTA